VLLEKITHIPALSGAHSDFVLKRLLDKMALPV